MRDFPVTPECLAELIAMIESAKISNTIAQQLLPLMIETGRGPGEIARERGMLQISDTSAIEEMVDKVIADNPKQLAEYQRRQDRALRLLRRPDHARSPKARPTPRSCRTSSSESLTRSAGRSRVGQWTGDSPPCR